MKKKDLYYERIPTKLLREDVRYLGNILGHVIKAQEGQKFFSLVEKVRKLSKANKVNPNSKKLNTEAGGVFITGVCTATSFVGDGSALTGLNVGLTTEALTTAGSTVTLDLTKDDHKITKSGTYTITCTGGTEAESHTLRIVNSGTATVSFSDYFLFPSGGTPNLPTASGAISLISFTVHRAGAVGINTQLLAGASVNFS